MREVPIFGIEPRRWTVVFHRKAHNQFFNLIAMGHFKHVSAFAFIPELAVWILYDVGFRRSRIELLADTDHAKTILAHIVKGNCTVTIETRDDNLPLMRLGMFCTTAIAHLVGLRCVALRPDALYRQMVKAGGVIVDDGRNEETRDCGRPEPCGDASGRAAFADR